MNLYLDWNIFNIKLLIYSIRFEEMIQFLSYYFDTFLQLILLTKKCNCYTLYIL